MRKILYLILNGTALFICFYFAETMMRISYNPLAAFLYQASGVLAVFFLKLLWDVLDDSVKEIAKKWSLYA